MGFRRGVRASVVVSSLMLSAAAPATAAPAPQQSPDALRADLDRILSDPRLNPDQTGLVVRDPNSHQVLYSRNGDRPRTPASNVKLLTSAAALDVLGPDHRFRTDVLASGQQRGATLQGDLHLRGTGDPTTLPGDYDRLAADVAAKGIKQVQGRVLTDDTFFDDQRHPQGWDPDDFSSYYGAPTSALTAAPDTDYDPGSVIVQIAPGASGQPADVQLTPRTSAVQVVNKTTTGAANSASSLQVQRQPDSNQIVVSGSVPAGSQPDKEYVSVPDPAAYAGDLFARALAAHGVAVGPVAAAPTPPGARPLAVHQSMTLREMLVPFLKLSNNGHAEALTKAMGRVVRGQGSWQAGIAVIEQRMRSFGVDPNTVKLTDGSGLSKLDEVPPEQFGQLLDSARRRPWFRSWYDALPIAGEKDRVVGGTLRNRMAGTPAQGNVHAKTGSMTGVTSISGYVTTADHRPLVFSSLFNGFRSEAPQDLEDAVAVRLAEDRGSGQPSPGVKTFREPAPQVDEKRAHKPGD
jgi:D-alanyl-D-alanine carboxypeptidase/D-alanyl-D-alanine-endopeptidase (penicillin-binding protein 4)